MLYLYPHIESLSNTWTETNNVLILRWKIDKDMSCFQLRHIRLCYVLRPCYYLYLDKPESLQPGELFASCPAVCSVPEQTGRLRSRQWDHRCSTLKRGSSERQGGWAAKLRPYQPICKPSDKMRWDRRYTNYYWASISIILLFWNEAAAMSNAY